MATVLLAAIMILESVSRETSNQCSPQEVLNLLGRAVQAANFERVEDVTVRITDLAEIRQQDAKLSVEEAADFDKQMAEDLAKVLRGHIARRGRLVFQRSIVGEVVDHDSLESIAADAATIRKSRLVFQNRWGKSVRIEVPVLVQARQCWKVLP